MAGVDANTLAEIKARIDIADLIAEYGVDVRRVGSALKACCPFHNEKTPSFHITPDKGFYHCFGCGEHGDIFSFVQKFEGLTFIDTVKKLAERAGVVLEERYDPQAKIRTRLYQINQELAAFYRRCLLQTKEATFARNYLEERDLMGEIGERFMIGYAPDAQGVLLQWAQHHGFTPDELVAAGLLSPPRQQGDEYYDRFHGRITFPICDAQGRVVAFSCRLLKENKHTGKYVNSPETAIFKKSNVLYALHLARTNIAKATPRRAIVCEGQIDVIRCHACGFKVAVASQGTAFTEAHVDLLKRSADTADLVFDGDNAGVKAALRTMTHFLNAGIPIRIVSLPEGEDPDSLLRNHGADAFRARLDAAEDPAPYLVRQLRKQEQNPDAMDATLRIAKAAVATVVACPEPVLTARFLQDTAKALGIPIATLEGDLEKMRTDAEEATRRREAFLARQAPHPLTPDVLPHNDSSTDTLIPDDDFVSEAFYSNTSIDDPEDFAEPAPAPNIIDLEASHNLAGALCELLAHHFTDNDVMSCLLRHLPRDFVHNPYAAKFYDIAIEASLAKRPTLTPPQDDPIFCNIYARVFASPDRVASAGDDITPLHYAQDLIRQYWLREYERRAKLYAPGSHELFFLTQSRKRLQTLTWEDAAPFMDALDPKLVAPAPHSPLPTTLSETPTVLQEKDIHITNEISTPFDTNPAILPEAPLTLEEDVGDIYDLL